MSYHANFQDILHDIGKKDQMADLLSESYCTEVIIQYSEFKLSINRTIRRSKKI